MIAGHWRFGVECKGFRIVNIGFSLADSGDSLLPLQFSPVHAFLLEPMFIRSLWITSWAVLIKLRVAETPLVSVQCFFPLLVFTHTANARSI